MSLLDRVLRIGATGAPSNGLSGGPLRLRAAMAGGSAALVSLLIIALPVLFAWVASSESTGDWPAVLSVGSCAWLLANGADLSTGSATISLTPWLLTAIPLVVATIAARRILMQLDDDRPRRYEALGGLRRDIADVGLAFVSSYAAVGLVVALATADDPLHASVPGSVLSTAVVGVVSVLVAMAREFRGQVVSVAPEFAAVLKARLPVYLRRALRPALWGVFAVFGAGLVLVLVTVVMQLDRIGRLYDALGADPVGVSMLTLGQLTVLPNVALWAASWMAGPGFGFGPGTAITWSHSNPGILPLLPGLGAVPNPGPMPGGLWLSVLVPVGAGVLVGWQALRGVSRLSSLQVKAQVAVAACVIAALILTAASALAGGSIGADRLSGVGALPLTFGPALLGELLLGALLTVLTTHLRTTRS